MFAPLTFIWPGATSMQIILRLCLWQSSWSLWGAPAKGICSVSPFHLMSVSRRLRQEYAYITMFQGQKGWKEKAKKRAHGCQYEQSRFFVCCYDFLFVWVPQTNYFCCCVTLFSSVCPSRTAWTKPSEKRMRKTQKLTSRPWPDFRSDYRWFVHFYLDSLIKCEPWAAMILRDVEARRRKAMEVCFQNCFLHTYFCILFRFCWRIWLPLNSSPLKILFFAFLCVFLASFLACR